MNRRPPSRSRIAATRRSCASAWSMIEMLESRQLLATFTVNNVADAAAVNPASGDATSTLGAGQITLRSAIQAADATTGASTINLPAGSYTLSIPATGPNDAASGDLNITGSLTLAGAGAATTTINANKIDRVLNITGTGTVVISGVTITGGDDSAANPQSQGGRGGGGIYLQNATLTLNDCAVNGNAANDYGGGGAGIYSTGANLTLNRTTVDSNVARDKSGGGGSLSGGGIYAAFGQTTILNSTISRNQVGDPTGAGPTGIVHSGGGIGNNFGGKLVVTNSTIRDNSSYGDYGGKSLGGGLYDNVGQVTLTNSTISGNIAVDGSSSGIVAGTGGGGIANFGSFLMSFLNITDCTISGNRTTGVGGGLFLNPSAQASASSDGFIDGTTIADNIGFGGAGIYFNEPQPYTIKNTILSRNFGDGPSDHENFTVGPQGGKITSLGHNLSTDETTTSVFTATGDLNSVADAKLGPLADNGGPTFTQALLAGSPALDAGDPAGAPATDQRGQPRIQGKTIDIGAYEFGSASSTSPTTTAIVSSLNPSQFGVPITLTATVTRTVSSGTPGGQVTFMEGSTTLGSGTIVASASGVGVATSPPLTLPVGKHNITAVYAGDASFSTSTSTPLVQTITLRPTTTTITASDNPAKVGQDVTFTIKVDAVTYAAGAAPSDMVTVTVDGAAPKSLPIAVVNGEGTVTFHTAFTTASDHTILASYSGGTEYAASTSTPYIEHVQPVSTAVSTLTAMTSAPNPSTVGQPVKLTAEVTPLFPVSATNASVVHASAVHAHQVILPPGAPPFAGSVTFRDGSKVLGVVRVKADGSATLMTTFLTAGRHALTATFAGDPNYRPSTSAADNQVVTGAVDGPRVVSVRRYGYHAMPTTLVIGFNGPLDPSSAGSAANYRISDSNGEPIGVGLAFYNPAAGTVTLYPVSQLDLHKRYTLVINGSGPGGVSSLGGVLLDGAGTGRPGSDFVTTVDAANLVVTNPFAAGASEALKLAAWVRAHDRG